MARYSLQLLKKEKVVNNAWKFILKRPKDFDFKAGQYVRVFDPVVGEAVFRDFTIASSPFDMGGLILIIKEGISEYKRHIFSAEVGQELAVDAPLGRFYIHDEEQSPLICIAGGVGITPFYSMIQYVKEKKLQIPITLIASFSKVEDVLFFNELKAMEEGTQNLKIAYTISQPKASAYQWNSHTGRISEELIKIYVKNIYGSTFLISGSPSFVIDMESLLTRMNITSRQIKIEVFLGFN